MENLLYSLNPWWEWKNWEEKDRDLKAFRNMKVRWEPSWIKEISLTPFSLNFIVGPRQVGKTTGVKLLVKKILCEVEPKATFYFNCDLISDMKELRNILDLYRRIKVQNGVKRSFIFLDEVTGVEYWWKIIKGYIDAGFFGQDVLTVMGSASFRMKRFSEAFPGRRGRGRNIMVLPINFKEYLKVHGVEPKIGNYDKILVFFEKYLKTGGFPRSINEDEKFLEDFIFSIERDISKANKSVKTFKMILRMIMEKAPSALGYNSIASEIGISHNTVREYIELMEDLFLVGVAYWRQGKKIDFKKGKKIFLRDPYMVRAYATILGIDVRKDFLYEWIVQEHLLRKYGEVYYWKNGFEIDCIADGLKIEVKAGKPHRRYPKGVRILGENEIPLFLMDLI